MKKKFTPRVCGSCGKLCRETEYLPTRSVFFPDGRVSTCNSCVEGLITYDKNWTMVDKICQWVDVPFIPEEWTKLYEAQGKSAIVTYINMALEDEYRPQIDWTGVNNKYNKLQEEGNLNQVHEKLMREQLRELKEKWGMRYSKEELTQLERLYQEMHTAYPIARGVQEDNVIRMAKISLKIDECIESGEKFNDYLTSYGTCMKLAQITPRSTKGGQDFESVGEIARWLEEIGWMASFSVPTPRDVVDMTIKNIDMNVSQTVLGDPNIREIAYQKQETYAKNQELEERLDAMSKEQSQEEQIAELMREADEDLKRIKQGLSITGEKEEDGEGWEQDTLDEINRENGEEDFIADFGFRGGI